MTDKLKDLDRLVAEAQGWALRPHGMASDEGYGAWSETAA